ncbi:MAG: methylenetetrahydrofolate reductase [Ilumatobacteraceae bacterium]|nr:methylenetetrahydrofolate reductase [Ilumatobacter sp.]MCO5331409.1 methylenetetrahydrofolate reductase [Ilumatobacteraceae bacterium]
MARISDLLAAGRTVSFEFFPPKHDAGWLSLGRTIAELEPLEPSFVSVTYGAGGSTRTKTADLVSWVRRQTAIPPMAHLTCQGHTRADIRGILTDYRAESVENILALGGDPPKDGDAPSDYRYSSELVEDVRSFGGFCVGVAAHPELHPRSADRATDRRHLADKLRVADFAITQFFFDADHYLGMMDDLAALGVDKPVLPGIMPISNLGQVARMAHMSGADVPAWVVERMEKAGDDLDEAERIGVDIATELSARLLEEGAPGLHLYVLNRSGAARQILRNLGLRSRA